MFLDGGLAAVGNDGFSSCATAMHTSDFTSFLQWLDPLAGVAVQVWAFLMCEVDSCKGCAGWKFLFLI